MADNWTDYRKMDSQEAQRQVAGIATKYGLPAENSDIDALATKNPEDRAAFLSALEAQYKSRSSNDTSYRPFDSQTSDPSQQAANAAADASRAGGTSDAIGHDRQAASTPTQSWNAQPAPAAPAAAPAPVDPFPAWYQELMTRQVAQQQAAQAEQKARADALYGTLSARANQGLQVNADDPVIKGQVDAFRAEGTRGRRDYLSDVAESAGPYANLRGEQRMTAEKLGQGVSGFQSELIGRELSARREEIAQALNAQGSILNADQNRTLTGQLAAMDQAIKEAGVGLQGRGLDLQSALGFGDLNLRDKLGTGGLDLQRDLGFAGLDLQKTLGLGGLDVTKRGQDLSMDQFLKELALREWQAGDDSDWRWASIA
jgi:hypothetical protein